MVKMNKKVDIGNCIILANTDMHGKIVYDVGNLVVNDFSKLLSICKELLDEKFFNFNFDNETKFSSRTYIEDNNFMCVDGNSLIYRYICGFYNDNICSYVEKKVNYPYCNIISLLLSLIKGANIFQQSDDDFIMQVVNSNFSAYKGNKGYRYVNDFIGNGIISCSEDFFNVWLKASRNMVVTEQRNGNYAEVDIFRELLASGVISYKYQWSFSDLRSFRLTQEVTENIKYNNLIFSTYYSNKKK